MTACLVILSMLASEHADEMPVRALTCAEVSLKAWQHEVPVGLAVAVAYHESRLDHEALSSAGAIGPMQVIPRYWPGDPVEAGMRALRYYVRKHGPDEGLARYNAGNRPGPKARAYARKVIRLWRRTR